MQIELTDIPGAIILTPKRFGDARGFFSESWNRQTFIDAAGLDPDFVQDNHSLSAAIYTVRGLHYQAPPHAQAKLVRCAKGSLLDVIVDIRKGSPAFGKAFKMELSFENGRQLYVPEGCLHGFATLSPDTEIAYKCTDYYAPEVEGAVRFDDPALSIDWGFDTAKAILSPKDEAAIAFADLNTPFTYKATS